MLAIAKSVEGDTSSALSRTDCSKFSAVSFRPGATSQNLSVLAVHSTITCKYTANASINASSLDAHISTHYVIVRRCVQVAVPCRKPRALGLWCLE